MLTMASRNRSAKLLFWTWRIALFLGTVLAILFHFYNTSAKSSTTKDINGRISPRRVIVPLANEHIKSDIHWNNYVDNNANNGGRKSIMDAQAKSKLPFVRKKKSTKMSTVNTKTMPTDVSSALVPTKKIGRPHFTHKLRPILPFYSKFLHFKTTNGNESEAGITIEEMLKTLRQNDSRIIEYIRKHHLSPPSNKPYNLTNPTVDDGLRVPFTKIIRQILKNKTGGFFIEAGTNDGELLSSTLGFERYDGWTGLCVEPSPIELINWRNKHRKCWLADVCLSPVDSPVAMNFLHQSSGYSIGSHLGSSGEKRVEDMDKWKVFRVPCFPLFSILQALEVNSVDYFNLDVEGVEMQVLETIPFDEILFRTISVELHSRDNRTRDVLKNFMASKRFKLVWEYDVFPHFVFAHPSIILDN